MDTRPNSPIHGPVSGAKRSQRYLHFALQPGDEEAIAKLPDFQQAVLKAEGSYASAAAQLGIPIGTFRSRLHRARSAIEKVRERRAAQTAEAANDDSLH